MSSWLSIALLLALVLQVLLVAFFAGLVRFRRINKLTWLPSPTGGWPPVEVVLCLRGADESLLEMLASLSRQNYAGEWRLQIVVDSLNDPSWKIVQEFVNAQPRTDCRNPTWKDVKAQTLTARPWRGSLKCASLLQSFEYLNNESVVVAFIDADAVVNSDWLSQLVQACLQPGVGAVSGNRWFVPENDTLIGWTRSVWNAGALVIMTLLAIPWGGSLAVRREVIDAGQWKKLLKHSFCEDTGLLGPLRELGLSYEYRPELLIVDRHDGLSLIELSKWISRQLLTARLHHPAWPLVALHGLATSALILVGIIQGRWLSLISYEFGCVGLLVWIEVIALQQRPRSLWGWAQALLVGQLLDGWATFSALLTRNVEWREVVYRVTQQPRGVALRSAPKSVAEE